MGQNRPDVTVFVVVLVILGGRGTMSLERELLGVEIDVLPNKRRDEIVAAAPPTQQDAVEREKQIIIPQ